MKSQDDSPILLAACSRDEYAGDGESGGAFTISLLELLRSVRLDTISYEDVIRRLPAFFGALSSRSRKICKFSARCWGCYTRRRRSTRNIRSGVFLLFESRNVNGQPFCSTVAGEPNGVHHSAPLRLRRAKICLQFACLCTSKSRRKSQ
jgi:hypothetical protein